MPVEFGQVTLLLSECSNFCEINVLCLSTKTKKLAGNDSPYTSLSQILILFYS